MVKVNREKVITLSNTIVEEIIKTKLKNKRTTMKKMAEEFNVDRRQVKLVIERENKRNQLKPSFTQISVSKFEYNVSDSDQHKPKMDDGQSNERNSEGNGGSSDVVKDREYEIVDGQSVLRAYGDSEDNHDSEHDQDEETEDGFNDNGGEATTVFPDSMQTGDFINNASNFITYVRKLETANRQLVNGITEKNEEIRNIYNDLIEKIEKNKQLEVENQILKKKNAVLEASQNDNKNQCSACNKKLVFTVGKMIVCRTCSEEIRGQLTVQAETNNANNL